MTTAGQILNLMALYCFSIARRAYSALSDLGKTKLLNATTLMASRFPMFGFSHVGN
jgi:hypothetical protein